MNPYGPSEENGHYDVLTEKQRRVLDLLIENKTSKEIARALGISPYTVDQRISLARGKLGASSRNELAARYRVMRTASGEASSDPFAISQGEQPIAADEAVAQAPSAADQSKGAMHYRARHQDGELTTSSIPSSDKNPCPTAGKLDYRVGPEVFEGRSGGLWRLGAIVATALFLVMVILGLFAIFDQLNDMLA